MKKILRNNARFLGAVLAEVDANFLSLCNAIIKLANPDLNLKAYADPTDEPQAPAENDCYLVLEDNTVFGLAAEANHIIFYNGAAWEILSFKITELNAMLQSLFFSADNISCTAPTNMLATNVQDALDELAAEVFPG